MAGYVSESGFRYDGQGTTSAASAKVAIGTLTRPANMTPYAVGDLIADNAAAGSVTPIQLDTASSAGRAFMGRRLRLKTDDTNYKGKTIRVHLFRNLPTVTVGDNGVFNNAETYAVNEADYIGYADVTLAQQFSDFVKGVASVDFISTTSPGTVIYALLEDRSGVTPAKNSSAFTLALEAIRD